MQRRHAPPCRPSPSLEDRRCGCFPAGPAWFGRRMARAEPCPDFTRSHAPCCWHCSGGCGRGSDHLGKTLTRDCISTQPPRPANDRTCYGWGISDLTQSELSGRHYGYFRQWSCVRFRVAVRIGDCLGRYSALLDDQTGRAVSVRAISRRLRRLLQACPQVALKPKTLSVQTGDQLLEFFTLNGHMPAQGI